VCAARGVCAASALRLARIQEANLRLNLDPTSPQLPRMSTPAIVAGLFSGAAVIWKAMDAAGKVRDMTITGRE
jgi:hypothetical protein